jgi:hypothetical protein
VRTAVVGAVSRWHKSGLLLRRLGCNPPGVGGGQPHSYRSGPAQDAATDFTIRAKNIALEFYEICIKIFVSQQILWEILETDLPMPTLISECVTLIVIFCLDRAS